MSALSKISKVRKDLTLPYNCYEVGHTWTPFCSEAAVDVGVHCFEESLKIYTPLYLLSLAFARKYTLEALKKTLKSIISSSFFLSFNAFAFIASLCSVRKVMGKFSFLHCSYIPGFLANILAIALERPNRRPALALYCTNLASETLFRMAVARKLLNPVPNGEVIIFSVVMASFLYIMRKKGFYADFVSLGLKFFLGPEEAKPKVSNLPSVISKPQHYIPNGHTKPEPPSFIVRKLAEFLAFVTALLNRGRSLAEVLPLKWAQNLTSVPRHVSCPHKKSCINYGLQGFLRPFLMGYTASVVLGLVSARRKVLMNFKTVMFKVLINKLSLRFALFIGGFAGVFKSVSCALRWIRGKDHETHAIPAGFLAGLCMMLSPNSSVALYLAWKLIEIVIQMGSEQGLVPAVPHFSQLLYSVSTAVLFYAAVLEPHNLKPTYRKFLNRISANKLEEINRHVLDIFGVHSSKLYHGFWPDLDMKYTSRSFQETVLVWMIH